MRELAYASRYLIPALWIVWIVGWTAAAYGVKRIRWREPAREAILNRGPVLLGVAILLTPRWWPAALTYRFVPGGPVLPVLGTLLVLGGLLFTVWARWHLGRNWSSTVAVKEAHTLVRSGPYRWVRHPIYSGLLAAFVGTALAIGAGYGFIGFALIFAGLLVKLLAEEARMRETFPAEYAEYCRHTARLIPGVY
ncbi:MAG TPA: isoprenylcysteine carboxylmethyltransferase family protein [Stellaceae bacterium]|nr:isoprenylcysteine carboxylmethyltransferase family protein [Stellaceae bacterium]